MLIQALHSNRNAIRRYCQFPCNIGKFIRVPSKLKFPWQTSNALRESFISYFEKHDHKYVQPCSVIDNNNGSYFTNSGVSQFRSHILGHDNPFKNIKNAVNSQRCIRLGGKKCDLGHIGYDLTHLSYFEMLGNWSFRTYDKRTACTMMWKYLTEILQLPPSHLYVTYFGGSEELGLLPDEETRDIWFDLGVKDSKILQFGQKDNFWEMSDRKNNPFCGPSTEIHWDYLSTFDENSEPRCARCFVNSDSPEVVELWNCVFMQYQWTENGTNLVPTSGLVIDTGMGLERLASVIQGVSGVYDTDNMSQIINHLSDLNNTSKYQGTFNLKLVSPVSMRISEEAKAPDIDLTLRRDVAYRIIADHLRTLCVCVFDGIQPNRQDVGLKLRHLLHRAIRQSRYGLEMTSSISPVIETICQTLLGQIDINEQMKNAIKKLIEKEENIFLPKLEIYEKTFENFLRLRESDSLCISEKEAQQIYLGKFGHQIVPDMIRAIAKDAGLELNDVHFEDQNYNETKPNPPAFSVPVDLLALKQISAVKHDYIYNYTFNNETKLYEVSDLETEVLLVLGDDEKSIIEMKPMKDVCSYGLITSNTNMYPAKGGQESDQGIVKVNDKVIANVVKVVELKSGHIIHWCNSIDPADSVSLSKINLHVNPHHRTGTTLHHTAHHIVFSGINILAGRIIQLSSSVKCDNAKFSFSVDLSNSDGSVLQKSDFIGQLENYCNSIITKAIPIDFQTDVDFFSINKNEHIRYVKSDQLPNKVRVISIGDTSEVCCGTHAHNTAHLQDIIITSFKSVNQATSEISFITGSRAVEIRQKEKEYLKMCDEANQQKYWKAEEIDTVIKKFNHIMSTEALSKTTRNVIKETTDLVHNKKNQKVGISTILRHNVNKLQNTQTNVCIFDSPLTSIKKIIQTITDMKPLCSVMIFENEKVLIYIPKVNAMHYVPKILENINQSEYKSIVETPKVKNIDSDTLDQYILITFSSPGEKVNQIKNNLKDMMNKIMCTK